MITENPTHLACPYCPAQAYLDKTKVVMNWFLEYKCPANHKFYIEFEDTSFNFGHNQEEA